MPIELKICEQCHKEFYGTKRARFCCDYCRVKWNRKNKKRDELNEMESKK